MATSIGARHVGTLDQAAPFSPFQTSGSMGYPGIPFGWNLEANEPFNLDLFLMQRRKRLNAIVIMILGQIRMGKTTLAKVLAKRHAALDFGASRCRISLADTRINANVQEYKLFTEFFGEKMVELNNHQLNPLDQAMGLAVYEQRIVIRKLLEYRNTELNARQLFILRLALDALLVSSEAPSLPSFARTLASLRLEDAALRIPYLRDDVNSLRAQVEEAHPEFADPKSEGYDESKITDTIRRQQQELRPGLTEEDLHRDAMELFYRVDNIIDGELGEILGGNKSIADVLSRRVVGLDYSRLDEDSIPLVESMFWDWRGSARKRRDSRFAVDIEIHDENYGSWEHLVYARSMYNHIKKIRQHGGAIIMNSHRLNDYYSVGAAGSPQRALATNMVKDVQGVFLARQDPEAIAEIRSRWPQVTATLGLTLTQLGRGCFCAIIGDEPPVLFRLQLTPRERLICESDQAGDARISDDYHEEAL